MGSAKTKWIVYFIGTNSDLNSRQEVKSQNQIEYSTTFGVHTFV